MLSGNAFNYKAVRQDLIQVHKMFVTIAKIPVESVLVLWNTINNNVFMALLQRLRSSSPKWKLSRDQKTLTSLEVNMYANTKNKQFSDIQRKMSFTVHKSTRLSSICTKMPFLWPFALLSGFSSYLAIHECDCSFL